MSTTIFLDVDGVLNREQDWRCKYTLHDPCIKALSALAKKFGCSDIVLTSTWRVCAGENEPEFYKNLGRKLEACGLKIVGTTPVSKYTRGEEVLYYTHRHECGNYLVIDDDPTLYENTADIPLYVCNHKTGFTSDDISKAYKQWKNFWR